MDCSQGIDARCNIVIKLTCLEGSSAFERALGPHEAPQILNRRDRVERARDDLARSSAFRSLGQTSFEQLRVGEDDPELVIEAVKQPRQFRA